MPTTLRQAMSAAYAAGGNAMVAARAFLGSDRNDPDAIRIAYDLQAGAYIKRVTLYPDNNARWCRQVADCLRPYLTPSASLLEVGSGDATTLAGVAKELGAGVGRIMGFDFSPARVAAGRAWLIEQGVTAETFLGDLFAIDLPDASVDVVYTSHSLEPNGGREREAVRECLRITRMALVLVEPLYELASPEAQARMRSHGYVRGLHETAVVLGAHIAAYRLLPYSLNPLNPSGVLILTSASRSPPN